MQFESLQASLIFMDEEPVEIKRKEVFNLSNSDNNFFNISASWTSKNPPNIDNFNLLYNSTFSSVNFSF